MSHQRPQTSSPSSSPADLPGYPTPATGKLPERVWLAALILFFLAPFCGEVLSTSTPPTQFFFDPVNLIFQPALYGSGALLIREMVRRRGLAWSNLLLLGAAYGILEEALVTNTWFHSTATLHILGIYGRALGVNWLWALELTAFHAVVSITIPIVLVEALFPGLARRPWLQTSGSCLFTALLTSASLAGAIGWGFIVYAKTGYPHPPLIYLLAVLLATVAFILGIRLQFPPPTPARRGPPSLWRLRFLGLGSTVVFFIIVWLLPSLIPVALVPFGLLVALLIGLAVVLRRWSTVSYWGAAHRLALSSGVLGFFMLLAPLVEAAADRTVDALLMLIIDVALAIVLIRLAQRSILVIEIPGSMTLPGRL
ncbi:MAG: hypothetical protein C5B60_01895 [Chloroflexi bacterium]|nr:MAG: hypothetical protein C5B60_01895 [Chloroflexota bacterium]